ncbi:MAG: hypothetical protein QM778_33670 [Myxococcales bacterium]
MADLEEHALKRDRRFVVRLVVTLTLAFIAGLFLFAQLTSDRTAGCAADTMLGTDSGPKQGAP